MSSTFLRCTPEKPAFRLRPSSSRASGTGERSPPRRRASSPDRISVGQCKSMVTGIIRRSRSLTQPSPATEETYHDCRLQEPALVSGLSSLVVSHGGSSPGEGEVPFCAISELQFEQVRLQRPRMADAAVDTCPQDSPQSASSADLISLRYITNSTNLLALYHNRACFQPTGGVRCAAPVLKWAFLS